MPSGRKTGHRCEFSPRSKSTSRVAPGRRPPTPGKVLEDHVRAEHDRPRGTPRAALPVRRIADDDRAPPATATFISLPRAKNPSDRPSGDQNRCFAPSVPSMAVASRESSDRTNRRDGESPLTAVNAIRRPIGDDGGESSAVPAGSDHVNCVRLDSADGPGARSLNLPPRRAIRTIARPAAPAMAQPRRTLKNRLARLAAVARSAKVEARRRRSR